MDYVATAAFLIIATGLLLGLPLWLWSIRERLNEIDADQPLWDDVKILIVIAAFVGGVGAFSISVFWLLGALGQAN